MEMFKKVKLVLTTLLPTETISFSKEKGAYVCTSTHVWFGVTRVQKTSVKDLVG